MRNKKNLDRAYIWTFTTYFTEGFPFTIIRTISGVFFRDMKVSLEAIGFTSFFGLPWILKFLWGPIVDEFSTKRRWLLTMQFFILIIMIFSTIVSPQEYNVIAIAILFLIGSFLAATHDIAIDGYYMEALDKDGQAKYVGYRVMAYRIAMMTGTGVVATVGTSINWFTAFLCASVIFACFFLYHLLFLTEVEQITKRFDIIFRKIPKIKTILTVGLIIFLIVSLNIFFKSSIYLKIKENFKFLQKINLSHLVGVILLLTLSAVILFRKRIKSLLEKNPDSFYKRAFIYFIDREKISTILAFIILLRTGEWTLSIMVAPFIVDLGIKVHYGWISGLVGLPAAIVGALLGGLLISKYSLKRVIWPFILLQNLTNVVYMVLAWHLADFIKINTGNPDPLGLGILNLIFVSLVHGFDQFASGLGNAVLMTYLMRICHQEYKAAHYAIGSGLMNLSGLFAGVMSGFIAGWLGYSWLFGISFLASVPAMLLIPFLPFLSENKTSAIKN